MADNIPSYVLEGIASLIEQSGQSPVAIAQSVGLNPDALYQSDILVSEIKINDLFEEAAQVCGERFFGVKAGLLKGLDMIGPLWLLAQHASTVSEMLALLSDNMALHSQGFVVLVHDEGDAGLTVAVEFSRLRLDLFQKAPKNTGLTQIVEHSMTVICKELRGSLGYDWLPHYVQFRHSAPRDTALLQKVFGRHLYFNQDVNAIHLSRADALAPNYRNPSNVISREAKRLVSRDLEASVGQGAGFVQRVGRIIRTLMNHQGVSAHAVAKTLNLPLRTLQYRLRKHGTSYQAQYDSVREDLAKHYLDKSELSVSAIAERLHFNDTAALSKFFKTRTGVSPSEYARCGRLRDQ